MTDYVDLDAEKCQAGCGAMPLWAASGTLRVAHTLSSVSKSVWYRWDPGDPKIMKSSI